MNNKLTLILVMASFSSMLSCRNATVNNSEGPAITSNPKYDSIEYYFEKTGYEDLKFQDTILGYMGYPSFDQYHLDTLSDRIYRLT